MALLIVFMHRENIKRLLNGTESKLDLSGKKKTLYAEAAEKAAEEENTSSEESEEVQTSKKTVDPTRPNPNTSKKKQKRNKK